MIINPFELFFWTFRRNEKDVVKLYDALSDVMRLATGGQMLNFGYWNKSTTSPIKAQIELCNIFANLAELGSARNAVDVGSGLSAPSAEWEIQFSDLEITCLNINFNQLKQSSEILKKTLQCPSHRRIHLLNATSTHMPFECESVDRVLALESAHHMKPFDNFVSESKRILTKDGILTLAIPVVSKRTKITKLGILSMTWSSERYSTDYITSSLMNGGFDIENIQKIGPWVYTPLVNYYTSNRESIKHRILSKYPEYVEKILFKSLLKMKQVSEKNVIDYLLIKCKKKKHSF